MTLFPSKVTFISSRWKWILGRHYSTQMVHLKTLCLFHFFFSTFNKIMQFSVTLSFHYNLVLVITRSCFTSEILNSNFLFSDDFSPFLFIFLYSCKTYTSNSLSFSSQSIPPILLFHQALIFAQINILS